MLIEIIIYRTSSLPNFSTLVTTKTTPNRTQTPPQEATETHYVITKPPPDYAEATKQINHSKEKKKSIKSQAVEDVLEILIKNGELPPSAAHEPTTPEKVGTNAAAFHNGVSMLPPNISNNNITNSTSHIDFNEFNLDLEGLAEAMDITVGINEKSRTIENNTNNLQNTQSSFPSIPSTELSLNEFMDFQECAINVDDADWLDTVMPPTSHSTNSVYVNSNQNDQLVNHTNEKQSLNQNSSKSNHDPLLPNTMVNGNHDPLIDLFFDDGDFKNSVDISSLMWDKVDFAM